DMILGDCTFLYMIFQNCRFHSTAINAEAVGMVFGLTRENLNELSFIYLGRKQEALAGEDPFQMLLDSYAEHRWEIGIAVTRVNFNLTSDVFALREYLHGFLQDAAMGRAIKAEELRFLMDVLLELQLQNRLPLLSVIELIESISRLLAEFERT